MASSTPPKPDVEPTDAELISQLRTLGEGRETHAAPLIQQLRDRDLSLNRIADESGIPRTTVKRWAGRADA